MTATSVAADAAVREGPPPLELRDLGVAFGGNVVLSGVNLTFHRGFNGLIGPNGAGKTTCFNVVSGYVRPTKGQVSLFGDSVEGRTQAGIAALGVGRTFQAPRLVQDETVLENVLLGMHHRYSHGHVAELFGLPPARQAQREARRRALDLLHAFGLGPLSNETASNIPLPGQKLVEVVRGLVSQPRLLLLDEPAAGLGATDVEVLLKGLRAIVSEGELCVVIIEHDLELVINLCSTVAVLNEGTIIADGAPQDVVKDPAVIEAYLGASVAED